MECSRPFETWFEVAGFSRLKNEDDAHAVREVRPNDEELHMGEISETSTQAGSGVC